MKHDALAEDKRVISDESDAERKNISIPEKAAPSPVPAPVLGGDDDFITVSAVRKIKVTVPPVPDSKPAAARAITASESHMHSSRDAEYSESSDNEVDSDSEPMGVIDRSPYEANQDAEKSEPLFARMKEILKEVKSGEGNRGKVSDEARKIFGASHSWDMVHAYCKWWSRRSSIDAGRLPCFRILSNELVLIVQL